MFTLRPGKVLRSAVGTILHDDIIGAEEGLWLQTPSGRHALCLRPTMEDFILKMPRKSQIIYPKDLGLILLRGDIHPAARVLQAGIGSGALAISLLRFIGPAGRLVSYELSPDQAAVAEENIRRFFGQDPPQHVLELRDIYAGIAERDLDTIILDVPEPERCVGAAAAALRPGGALLVWLPTTPQVHRLVAALKDERRFGLIETVEQLLRPWYVSRISMRPEHRMVAHTGFLISARRCEPLPGGADDPEDAHEPLLSADDA